MKRTSLFLFAFFTLTAAIFLPLPSQAIGQMTEPIILKGAMRLTPYNEMMMIVNTEKTASTIRLSAEGAIAEWVKFYKDAADTDDITDMSMQPGERAQVYARFTVPAEIPNGSYTGHISVLKIAAGSASDSKDSESSVSQKIDREATVEVSDAENIAFDTSVIPKAYDLSRGDLLRVRIIYDNYSNVLVNPQIAVKIVQDNSVIYNAIFPYPDNQPEVSPNSLFEIPALEIPTSNLEPGKYKAVLVISQGDKSSIEKSFDFSIGAVLAANTAAPAPTNDPPLVTLKQALLFSAGLILYVIFRIWKRKNRKFEGQISIESLSQE